MSVLNIVPPPWPVLKFRDLVRKWHHNSDDSTDISFRLILSVLYFSLISISSCAIKPLKNKLFSVTSNPSTLVVFSGRALTVVLQKIIIITNKHILWFNFTVESLWDSKANISIAFILFLCNTTFRFTPQWNRICCCLRKDSHTRSFECNFLVKIVRPFLDRGSVTKNIVYHLSVY